MKLGKDINPGNDQYPLNREKTLANITEIGDEILSIFPKEF